ncbi:MAG: LysR family transcriptional regulator [Desulfovibrionaceae bacterium]
MLDIGRLETFLAVCEEENLTRAAERRHLSTPAAGAQIRQLEDELGLRLFERTSRGMFLTEEGRALRESAEAAVRAARGVFDAAQALRRQPSGSLRLALNAAPETLRLAELASRLKVAAPGLALDVLAASSVEVVRMLARREIDLGFLFGEKEHEGVARVELGVCELVVAGAPSLGITAGTWEELSGHPWITCGQWCPYEQAALEALTARGLPRRAGPLANGEHAKGALAEAGLGLAVLEASEAEPLVARGGVLVWRPEPLPCPLSIAFREDEAARPAVRLVAELLREVWARTPG